MKIIRIFIYGRSEMNSISIKSWNETIFLTNRMHASNNGNYSGSRWNLISLLTVHEIFLLQPRWSSSCSVGTSICINYEEFVLITPFKYLIKSQLIWNWRNLCRKSTAKVWELTREKNSRNDKDFFSGLANAKKM